MQPYIFGDRKKVHIINLEKTLECLEPTIGFCKKLAASNNRILFVGTKRAARRVLSKIAKTEQKFRKEMLELEQAFLQDPRSENKKAARDIKKSYKQGVTTFMRDAVQMIKRMK